MGQGTPSLTPGERLVRCLTGQPVDRIPFGVGLCWAPWGATLEKWRLETGRPDLLSAIEIGADPGFAHPKQILGFSPVFEKQVIREDADFIVTRDARGITLRNRRDHASIPEFLDYPVKTRDDWERLKAERMRIDDPARLNAENWPEFHGMLQESGRAVQVGGYPFGVFGTMRDLMGVEALLVAFYDDPDMMHDMMDHLTSVWLAVWRKIASEVHIDHIHIWEDMSGRQGSLISPAMVEEFMMPCYDRIAAFARESNVALVSVDTDGDCGELVPLMMRHGVNLFMPFEVQAGNDILEYRKKYPGLGIMGGLDKRALALGRREIDREVKRAAEMLKTGRYLPGWDHLIPPDVPWANFMYAADRIRELCQAGGLG